MFPSKPITLAGHDGCETGGWSIAKVSEGSPAHHFHPRQPLICQALKPHYRNAILAFIR
jgi:hypothetical protein